MRKLKKIGKNFVVFAISSMLQLIVTYLYKI